MRSLRSAHFLLLVVFVCRYATGADSGHVAETVSTLESSTKREFVIGSNDCKTSLTIWRAGSPSSGVAQYKRGCNRLLRDELLELGALLDAAVSRHAELRHVRTVAWGKLEQPELVLRLIEGWANANRGLKREQTNDEVMKVMRSECIFREVFRTFADRELNVDIAAVENAFFVPARDLPRAGIEVSGDKALSDIEVPYTALVWLRVL